MNMKNKFSLLILAVSFVPCTAFAVPQRMNRDLKLPTQQQVEKQTLTNPAAAGAAQVLSANAGATSAAIAVASTFLAQPDVARNLVITPAGTTGDVEDCVVVVAGTNYSGAAITEDFTFLADASTAQTGSKAFKTVASVTFPANCESGGFAATWSVGYGEKLGLKNCLDAAGHILFSTLNGAKEGTAPTMAASTTAIESNTADFNGTMNGSNDFELFYFQNFRCQ
jgi:hypothetical protein